AGPTNPIVPGTNSSTSASGASTSSVHDGRLVGSAAPEELVVVANANARYTFTSRGGGLKLIELKKYPESVGCRNRNGFLTNKLATLNTKAPVPAFALLGSEALQGDGNFT